MAVAPCTGRSCAFVDLFAITTGSDPHESISATPTVSLPSCSPQHSPQTNQSSYPIISNADQSADDAVSHRLRDNIGGTGAVEGRNHHMYRRIRRQPKWVTRQAVDASDVEALWVLSVERLTSRKNAVVKLPRKTIAFM